MSKSNKEAKEELIRLYGAQCFIDRLHLRPESTKVYTGKQLQYMKKHEKQLKRLTYHHILERCKGGKATRENGALLSEENHRWFNQQSKENQAKMNQAFQDLKAKIDNARECKIQLVDSIDVDAPLKMSEIVFSSKGEIKERGAKIEFNRAKEKRKFNERIKEEMEDYER